MEKEVIFPCFVITRLSPCMYWWPNDLDFFPSPLICDLSRPLSSIQQAKTHHAQFDPHVDTSSRELSLKCISGLTLAACFITLPIGSPRPSLTKTI